MKDYFRERRTVRSYSQKEVSDEMLREIIERASHAPTTGNMQLYSVVVTCDEAIKDELAPAHFSQPAFVNAPVILTFCADLNRFVKWCEASDAQPGYDNIQTLLSAVLDTAIFAQQVCTIAEMEGLGCCYLGTTTYNPDKIAEVLRLPKLVVPVTTLSLGWPEGETRVSDRLPVDAVMHSEVYRDDSHDEVKAFFKDKEDLDESKRFVAENGKQSLAQVFTDVRYPKATNEAFSKVIFDFIARAGFPWPHD